MSIAPDARLMIDPAPCCDHDPARGLAPEEHALEVHREDAVELLLRRVEHETVDDDRRVVDHHVEVALVGDDLVDQRLHVGAPGDVEMDRCGAVTVGPDHRRGLGGGGLVDVGAHHGGAGLGETGRDGPAEAAPGAGHEGHAVGQVEGFRDGGHGETLRCPYGTVRGGFLDTKHLCSIRCRGQDEDGQSRWGSQSCEQSESSSTPRRWRRWSSRTSRSPSPGRARSLVKVSAASLNYGDIARCRGTVASVMGQVPFTIGMDVCGVVESAGEGGEEWVGRRVVATTVQSFGGVADYALVGRDRRVRSPAGVRRRPGGCVHAAVPHRLPGGAAPGEAAGGGGAAGDRWRHRRRHRDHPARQRGRRARGRERGWCGEGRADPQPGRRADRLHVGGPLRPRERAHRTTTAPTCAPT